MAKENKGRYYLKHISNDGIESTFRIKTEKGKYKESFPLTTLDMMTSSCDNMQELLELAREMNIPKKNSNDEWLDGYCYIEYKNNKETRQLNVVFSDNITINLLSRTYEGLYTMPKNQTINAWVYKIADIRRNQPELYKYLRDNKYLDEYLSELIGNYVFFTGEDYQNPSEANRYKRQILAKLESYKTFRDICVGIDNYNKEKILHEEEPQKVKRMLPPKGAQLSFRDLGHNI